MSTPELHNQDPRQFAVEILNQSNEALKKAVSIVSPETPDASPFEVFAAAMERRADDKIHNQISYTEDQEVALRTAASELGFGRASNRTATELGLSRSDVVLEGGQAHKILAEALLIIEDDTANPSAIFISASPYRQIPDVEKETTAKVLNIELDEVGATEYEVAEQVADKIPGFVKYVNENELEFGYDINNNYELSTESNGQFLGIGRVGDVPVVLFRVDRLYFEDENGELKYNQPGTTEIIKILDSVSRTLGDETTPIAYVSSCTYQPSREVDGARAALSVNRKVGIPTYGTELLARVKNEPQPAPGPIEQLPGELHKMAQQVQKLQEVIDAK